MLHIAIMVGIVVGILGHYGLVLLTLLGQLQLVCMIADISCVAVTILSHDCRKKEEK